MDAQETAREDANICAGIKRAQKPPVYKPRTVAVNSDKHDANDFVRRLMSKNRSMRQQIRMLRMKARLAEKKTMQEKREQVKNRSRILNDSRLSATWVGWQRWTRYQQGAAADRRRVAATSFHSVLIQVEVRHKKEWKRVLAIADTGSGPTILRMVDLASVEEMHAGWEDELDPADVRLLTADGWHPTEEFSRRHRC
jgi:hypothetical protein